MTIWLWALVALGILVSVVGVLWAVVTYLPRGRFWRGIGLQDGLPLGTGVQGESDHSDGDRGETSIAGDGQSTGSLQGLGGVAITDLHPAGAARIGEKRVDVVTEGDFITSGTEIEVVLDEGYRRVVQRSNEA